MFQIKSLILLFNRAFILLLLLFTLTSCISNININNLVYIHNIHTPYGMRIRHNLNNIIKGSSIYNNQKYEVFITITNTEELFNINENGFANNININLIINMKITYNKNVISQINKKFKINNNISNNNIINHNMNYNSKVASIKYITQTLHNIILTNIYKHENLSKSAK